MTLDMAKSELEAAGIMVGTVEEVYSSDEPAGYVCYQNYPVGSYIEKSISVNLQISKGAHPSTYSYKANIEAPTVAEAPEYNLGDVVDVSLVTSDGKILLSTRTSTFPIIADYAGITSATGTITITYEYEVVVESDAEVPSEGTEQPSVKTEKRTKSFTRSVEFTKE
jgi:serine/threonine-protein kinase